MKRSRCIHKSGLVCLIAAGAAAASASAPADKPALNEAAPVSRFVLAPTDYAMVSAFDRLELSGVELAPGVVVNLSLQRHEVFAPGARIVLGTPGGDVPLPSPELAAFRGTVNGGGSIALAVSPYGVNGVARHDGATYVISSGPLGAELPTVSYNLTTLPEGLINWREFTCAADELNAATAWRRPGAQDRHDDAQTVGTPPCRIANIAVETDNEFTANIFGGSSAAATAYVGALFTALTDIYEADLNAHMQVGFLRLWTSTSDPWTSSDCLQRLFDFQDYWNANMTGVSRNAAHFLSGLQVSGCGGVAYLPGLCQAGYDYGMSSYLNGSFPYPVQNFNSQNWDLMVTAHELGHNFGAPHTHDVGIDGCGQGDCSQAFGGTIMSYCHTCSGGMSNIAMTLHPVMVSTQILPYLDNDAPCNILASAPSISDQPDSLNVCIGQSASFTVVAGGTGPLAYQWYRNNVAIGGATASTYSIAAANAGHAGTYKVEVTNACSTTTSNTASLNVGAPVVGDLNNDCVVNQADLALLLSCYLTSPCGDVDNDGDTDQADLAALLANYTN